MKLSAVAVPPVRPAPVGLIVNSGSAAQPAEQVTVSAAAARVPRSAERVGQKVRAVMQFSEEVDERSSSYRRGHDGRNVEHRKGAAGEPVRATRRGTASRPTAAIPHRADSIQRPVMDRNRDPGGSSAPFAAIDPAQTPGAGRMSQLPDPQGGFSPSLGG